MKIFIVYATAGHGHRMAAQALLEEFEHHPSAPYINVSMVDTLQYTRRPFGFLYTFWYWCTVTYVPRFWGLIYHMTDRFTPLRVSLFLRDVINSYIAAPFEKYLIAENPEIIITTHFMGAEIASRLKREGKIQSKIITVVTDFIAHRYWITPGFDFITGMVRESERVLLKAGVERKKIRMFGIPVSSRFLQRVDRARVRRSLGLEPHRLTLLITSGSFGIGLRQLIRKLRIFREKIQAIVVCGNNKKLYDSLMEKEHDFPIKVLGFVDNMHELMGASDILLSRSSGLTTSESLVSGIPLAVISMIPGQEKYNAKILRRYGAARICKGADVFVRFMHELIDNPEILIEMRENIKKVQQPRASTNIVNFALSLMPGQ